MELKLRGNNLMYGDTMETKCLEDKLQCQCHGLCCLGPFHTPRLSEKEMLLPGLELFELR